MQVDQTFAQKSLITPAELAERLHVSRKTLSRWEKAGYFPAPIRIGKRVIRWRLEDIIRFIGQDGHDRKPLASVGIQTESVRPDSTRQGEGHE